MFAFVALYTLRSNYLFGQKRTSWMIIVVSNKKESAAKTSHSHLSVRQSNNYGKLNYLCIVEML